jgi:predicted  nucleic acid-binding Zn-ribbon protein
MPHWNCARCGARLYSASKTLKRNSCPVCQGRLVPLDDVSARAGRQGDAGARRGGVHAPDRSRNVL